MKLLKLASILILPALSYAQIIDNKLLSKSQSIDWYPSEMIQSEKNEIRVVGNPEIINSKFGKAVHFNGVDDGIFLDQKPLEDLEQFTVEVIFYPESKVNFEQRLLHIGEIRGNRVLFETRSTAKEWYFDAYINSGDHNVALIDSTLLHPLDQWYHLAFVADRGNLTSYVNGIKELENHIEMTPLQGGKTSIGVRQNNQSWFKGSIYQIRITPEVLKPSGFIPFK